MSESWLSEIRQRVERATKGPWQTEDVFIRSAGPNFSGELVAQVCRPLGYPTVPSLETSTKANRDFIAHSRVDLPALLAVANAAAENRDQPPTVFVLAVLEELAPLLQERTKTKP